VYLHGDALPLEGRARQALFEAEYVYVIGVGTTCTSICSWVRIAHGAHNKDRSRPRQELVVIAPDNEAASLIGRGRAIPRTAAAAMETMTGEENPLGWAQRGAGGAALRERLLQLSERPRTRGQVRLREETRAKRSRSGDKRE
jgi:hypothetical protein